VEFDFKRENNKETAAAWNTIEVFKLVLWSMMRSSRKTYFTYLCAKWKGHLHFNL